MDLTTILMISQITISLPLVALVIALVVMSRRQQRTISRLDGSLRIEIAGLDAEIHQMYNGKMPDWFKLNTNKFRDEIDENFKILAKQNKVRWRVF